MSRLIKFRAWDKGEEMMLDDVSLVNDTWDMLNEFLKYTTDEIVFMQFTGLHDKNGVEIYEGDVLDIENEGYPFVKNWKGIVKFIDGSYLIENFEGTDGEYLFDETREVKVIGNIYEHQHLIEGS